MYIDSHDEALCCVIHHRLAWSVFIVLQGTRARKTFITSSQIKTGAGLNTKTCPIVPGQYERVSGQKTVVFVKTLHSLIWWSMFVYINILFILFV